MINFGRFTRCSTVITLKFNVIYLNRNLFEQLLKICTSIRTKDNLLMHRQREKIKQKRPINKNKSF